MRIAQSRVPGPVPLPMARIFTTPAARARSSISARSVSNLGPSRCAWESTSILLEASADRDVFEKAGEDRQAFLADRSGDNHAVRLDSAQLSRLKIGNDDYFHSDDLLRRILFRDARNDSANF